MKHLMVLLFISLYVSTVSFSQEKADDGYEWLTETDWMIEMTDDGDYIYWNQQPFGRFRENSIPHGNSIYREWLPSKYFSYYYPVGNDHMVCIGFDYDNDGKDDILDITSRDGSSYFMLVHPIKKYLLLGGGTRKGEIAIRDNPFIGVWLGPKGEFDSEVRLVKPANYRYFLEIDEIPGFGIRKGWYLLKQIGTNSFESDATWPDGHIRIDILSKDKLLLTPLFTLPREEGMVQRLQMRAIGTRTVPNS